MATKQFFSGLATSCASAITNSQTSITGQSTTTWNTAGDYIVRIDGFAPGTSTAIFEDVLVTANNQSTGVFNVTRGQDGTSGQAFAAGATLTPVITLKMITDAFVRLDAANAGALTIQPSASLSAPTTSWGTMPVKIDDILIGTDTRYLAATAQVTFLNTSNSGTNLLPTGFRDLEVRWYARGDTAATSCAITLRFNNISTATYDWELIKGTANTAAAVENLAQTGILLGDIPANTATANYFGQGRAFVNHYNGAVGNKLVVANSVFASADTSGNTQAQQYTGKWRTTATAVTRLDLLASAGNFIAGSYFSLWGIP